MEIPVSYDTQIRTTDPCSVTVVLVVVLMEGFVTNSEDKQRGGPNERE
jgi:hypothetical protein